MAAGEVLTVAVENDLGITALPYGVILLGTEPFAATEFDSPTVVGGMQGFNR